MVTEVVHFRQVFHPSAEYLAAQAARAERLQQLADRDARWYCEGDDSPAPTVSTDLAECIREQNAWFDQFFPADMERDYSGGVDNRCEACGKRSRTPLCWVCENAAEQWENEA